MNTLHDNIRYMKGIGEQRAKALEKLGITSVWDMLNYFPRAYEDRRQLYSIAEAPLDLPVCVRATAAHTAVSTYIRKGMELTKLQAVDDSGVLDITWFNQSYIKNNITPGTDYIFYGRVSANGRHRSMTNPLFETEQSRGTITGRIVPVYRLTRGVSQNLISVCMRQSLNAATSAIPDVLPEEITSRYGLAQIPYAYENIHFPRDEVSLDNARRRLVFEELFILAGALSRLRATRTDREGVLLKRFPMEDFWDRLSFSPTHAQHRAVEEALSDMTSGKPMSRLLQGDVGSGKTLVAAALLWQCAKNGCQAAFMAPTGILADQHYETLTSMLDPFGIRIVKLTGGMTAAQKRKTLELLSLGMADVVVGTHALLNDSVQFRELALVVTDEQHRFGVEQRSALSAKGRSPHVFVMSATPIPRTLALIIYGDLDISVLDELPPGRQKVGTYAVNESMRERIWKFVRKQVAAGRQVFIVCPMVEENEELPETLKSVETYAKELQLNVFPDLRVSCIHGKLRPKEKEHIIADFAAGNGDILVSTTVIEVGVDIPNASLMIVENADRFGLSQLHQLRGRVGRGSFQSYCILFSDNTSEDAKARLSVMTRTNDGFEISREDLRLRGPGDFFGSRQHGLPEMHVADLSGDMRILKAAQAEAQRILTEDPALERPEHKPLKQRIEEMFRLHADTFN